MSDTNIQTFEDFADALWLTLILATKNQSLVGDSRKGSTSTKGDQISGESVQEKQDEKITTPTLPKPQKDGFPVNVRQLPEPKQFPDQVMPIGFVPIPKTSISALDIQRGFKPLKKLIPSSAMPAELDIERTLEQFAKNYITAETLAEHGSQRKISLRSDIPVLTQGKERWLDLVLIIDTSNTMQFFDDQIAMIMNITAQSGIFRKIETYYLSEETTADGYSRPNVQKNNDFSESTSSIERIVNDIINPNGRRIVLFLSSCTSKMWHDWTINIRDQDHPTIGKMIYEISKHHPLAIFQMLPERLWFQTGISYFEYCKAWASTALTPNTNLKLSVTPDKGSGFAIPILSFDPQRILSWARMLNGKTDLPVLSMYVADEYTRYPRTLDSIEQSTELNERLELFLRTAPKQLVRFMGYLSVMPNLTMDHLRQIRRDLFPDLELDFTADLAATGLVGNNKTARIKTHGATKAKTEVEEGISQKIGFLPDAHPNRPLFWATISYPNRLEGMAYYYEFIAKSKFYDKDDNQVGFWVYLDNRVAREHEIHAKDKAGEEMLGLFEGVIQWSTQKPVPPLDGIQVYPFPGIIEPQAQIHLSSELNMKPAETPDDFDFSHARLIDHQDYSYLRLPCLNVGLWGDTGIGKTSFLKSIARDFFVRGDAQIQLQVIDHYGNLVQHPNAHIKPDELNVSISPLVTKNMEDQLMSLNGLVGNRTMQRLFCFHDFPGSNTTVLTEPVTIAYNNCDALFMFISAQHILSPSSQEKTSTTRNFSVLLNWIQDKQASAKLKYLALIITKSDLNTGNVLANTKDPWDYLSGHLDSGIIQALRYKTSQVFVISSLGKFKPDDWRPNNTSAPLIWLWEQENMRLRNNW